MSEFSRERVAHREIGGGDSSVDKVAAHALAQVARRACAMRADPDRAAIDLLYEAAVGRDPLACGAVARGLMARSVSAERICDVYVPAVARRMGDDWCTDDLSFSDVTIGSARLQYLLREIGASPADEVLWAEGEGEAILLLVAPEADHTLGALVLASQLRRRGYSVRLSLGETDEILMENLTATRFDAVFFTACVADSLPFLERILNKIRGTIAKPPPFVLGGAVLENEGRAVAIAGIDMVTSDVDEALAFCGLTDT